MEKQKFNIWITTQKGKKGTSFKVRWQEPGTCKNRQESFKSRREAEEFKVEKRRELESQTGSGPVEIKFMDWVERHLEGLRREDTELSEASIRTHRDHLKMLYEVCRPETLTDITPDMIREFRLKMLRVKREKKCKVEEIEYQRKFKPVLEEMEKTSRQGFRWIVNGYDKETKRITRKRFKTQSEAESYMRENGIVERERKNSRWQVSYYCNEIANYRRRVFESEGEALEFAGSDEIMEHDENYSKSTINGFIRTIRSALSYAVRDGFLKINPLFGPHKLTLREDECEIRIPEIGEIEVLFKTAENNKERLAIHLAYYHGMRKGEISWLRWSDINFKDNTLSIKCRDEWTTKSKRSRVVAIRQSTMDLLEELYKDRVSSRFVFDNPKTFYNSVKGWFGKLIRKGGLDYFSIHDLRRACNTFMQDNGIDIEVAMQVLGHRNVRVNRDHYTGRLSQRQREAVESLPSID